MEQNRNYIVAIALSVLVLIAWQFLYLNPQIERERAAQEALQQQQSQEQTPLANGSVAPPVQQGQIQGAGSGVPGTAGADGTAQVEAARIDIETPSLSGSLNLRGARIDDLRLNNYRETVDPNSPTIELLAPSSMQQAYFAEFGYLDSNNAGAVPNGDTVWTVSGDGKLTPSTPVVLSWTNDKGVTFERTISIDDGYMFEFTDKITNNSDATLSVSPYGRIARFYLPETTGFFVLHEGLIGVVGEEGLQEIDYGDIEDDRSIVIENASTGWLGFTDKYWATALIPEQARPFQAQFLYNTQNNRPSFQTNFLSGAMTIAPGQTQTTESHLFAGAKEVPLIRSYETDYNIQKFDLMIDWGWFHFITKPLFWVLDYFFRMFGNFGVAILLTTVIVKLFFFPLANKSYVSMANMKKVQPKMEEIKAKHGDDRQAMQQAMMKLYKEEKINPIAGCWPMLLQIPVFFALYKVLLVTIEMRHAPFFGWIQDLSAPDPTTIFNLFGVIPWDPPQLLMLGIWPLIMGVTMFLQMRMNPTPPDPTQAMIFTWMPVVFTFMLAAFPAGLVIYWAWNNTLSIIQQAVIMKRQGAKIELWDNLVGMVKKKPKAAE